MPSSAASELSPLRNVGSTQNSGHELSLTAQVIVNNLFDSTYWDPGVGTADGVRFRRIADGAKVERQKRTVDLDPIGAAKSGYKHFMLKEIFEQPRAISDTLESVGGIGPELFGEKAASVLPTVVFRS